MNPVKAFAQTRRAQAIKKSPGVSVTHLRAARTHSFAEDDCTSRLNRTRKDQTIQKFPGVSCALAQSTCAQAPAKGGRTSKPIRKRWAHLVQRVSLALGALMFSLPTCAFAEGGSTDVTVRGDLVQAAPAATRSAGTLAQTGVSADAWRLVAAGTVLALAAAAALLVLRRGRHGH